MKVGRIIRKPLMYIATAALIVAPSCQPGRIMSRKAYRATINYVKANDAHIARSGISAKEYLDLQKRIKNSLLPLRTSTIINDSLAASRKFRKAVEEGKVLVLDSSFVF